MKRKRRPPAAESIPETKKQPSVTKNQHEELPTTSNSKAGTQINNNISNYVVLFVSLHSNYTMLNSISVFEELNHAASSEIDDVTDAPGEY